MELPDPFFQNLSSPVSGSFSLGTVRHISVSALPLGMVVHFSALSLGMVPEVLGIGSSLNVFPCLDRS